MDAVLGLSVTPSAVGLVLVEGQEADGATMDRDAFEVRSGGRSSALKTSEQAAAAVLRSEAIAATRGHRLHSIGVTWSDDADAEASLLLKSLTDSGFGNVVPVRFPEATEALARGIAEVIGFDTTAVCIVEPEAVITLIVHTRDGSVQTAINHAIDSDERLIRWLSGVFTRADWQPKALVVVGSGGGLDDIMPALEDALSVPVFAPAEAGLALARGAALASTQNTDLAFTDEYAAPVPLPRHRRHEDRRRRPLAQSGPVAMLAAGTVTFVVSVSIAISMQITPKRDALPAELRPAAVTSSEIPAAAKQTLLPVARPAPIEEAPPEVSEAPPADLAPAEEAPPSPDVADQATVPDTASVEGLAPEPPAAPMVPDPAVPAPALPEQVAPDAPPPERGLLDRIRDRLAGIDPDSGQQAPVAPPPDAPPLMPPPS
ncbi:DUF7159 family protein [Mycobacterium sp. URHB0021]